MSLTNLTPEINPRTSLQSCQHEANDKLSRSATDSTCFFFYRCLFDDLLRQPVRLIEPEQQAPRLDLSALYPQHNFYHSSSDDALYDALATAIEHSDLANARWLLASHPEPLALRKEPLTNDVLMNMSWHTRQRVTKLLTTDEPIQPLKLYDVLQDLQPQMQMQNQNTVAA